MSSRASSFVIGFTAESCRANLTLCFRAQEGNIRPRLLLAPSQRLQSVLNSAEERGDLGRQFDRTVVRDRANVRRLQQMGWKVLVAWECQVKDDKKLANRLLRFLER